MHNNNIMNAYGYVRIIPLANAKTSDCGGTHATTYKRIIYFLKMHWCKRDKKLVIYNFMHVAVYIFMCITIIILKYNLRGLFTVLSLNCRKT